MKTRFVLSLLFILVFHFSGFSQDYVVEDNGSISFSKVLESADKLSKSDIFSIVETYFSYNYNDGKSVIQTSDKEKGIIVGKGIYPEIYKSVNSMIGRQTLFDVEHVIRIDCKDEKVRVIITVSRYKETQGNWMQIEKDQKISDVFISGQYPIVPAKKENKLSREEKTYNEVFLKLTEKINNQFSEIQKTINKGNSKLENEAW